MIANKRISESKRFLEKAIDYNKKIQNKLKKLVAKSTSNFKELSDDPSYFDTHYRRAVWEDYYFYDNIGFVSYYTRPLTKILIGFITNVINVTESSKDTEVQFLIDELKKTYNYFVNQLNKKEDA